MSLDLIASFIFAAVLITLVIRGARATWEINKIYQGDPKEPKSIVFRTIRDASLLAAIAAAWFSFWNLKGLLTGITLEEPWTSLVRFGSLIIAAAVLDLPSRFLKMTHKIMAREIKADAREDRLDVREDQLDVREDVQDARDSA